MKKNKLPIWALVVMDLAAGAVCVGLVLLVLYVLPQGTTVSEQETQEATAQFALPSQGSGESAASAEGGLGIPAASPEQLEPCGHHFAGGEPRRDTGVCAGEKDEKNAD